MANHIGIVGAGAVGCVVGGMLTRAGETTWRIGVIRRRRGKEAQTLIA